MDDLIRAQIHQALDVEPPPADLRHAMIWAVPLQEQNKLRGPRLRLRWAPGLIAVLLAIAVVLGFAYTGLVKFQINSAPVHTAPRFVSPEGIAVGPDGSVYVGDFKTGFVFRVRPDGTVTPFVGGGTAREGRRLDIRVQHPVGLAIDRDGFLYIAEPYLGAVAGSSAPGDVLRVEPRGVVLVYAPVGAIYGPIGLAVDSVGSVYFTSSSSVVGSMSRGGGVNWAEIPPLGGPLPSPSYLAFDSQGNLFFSDGAPMVAGGPGGCRIGRVTPDHVFSVVAGTGTCGFSGDGGPAAQAELDDPTGIAFDSVGNLYFSDSNNHRIRRIDAKGIITTVVGTGQPGTTGDGGQARAAQLSYPFGIGIGPGDVLYIADASCNCDSPSIPGRVREVDLRSGVITSLVTSATPIQKPSSG